jgi:acid stress-induced BolA-like protein IbaG/YrbA
MIHLSSEKESKMTDRDAALTLAYQHWRARRDQAKATFQEQVQRHQIVLASLKSGFEAECEVIQEQVQRHQIVLASLKSGFEAECEVIDRQYHEKIGAAYAPDQR